VDAFLAYVDRVTQGRAGALQRLFTYIIVGALSAGVNLLAFQFLYTRAVTVSPSVWRYLLAYAGSAEVSVVTNFILNDRYTFQRLAGHARPWRARLLRFHATATGGILLTLMLSLGMRYGLQLAPLLAQAAAILAALIFNLSMHYLWTYRPLRATRNALD
jgi:putative flippase GtrA